VTELDGNFQLKRMMERAFEQAFQQHLGHLFNVYVTGMTTNPQQKEFSKKGIENAIEAYWDAMTAVEQWWQGHGPDS
jgi:hypothetical protein